MIEAGCVARIEISGAFENIGRIVEVMGRLNERYWIVSDGMPFRGYRYGTPGGDEPKVTRPCLAIESYKLRRVY